MPIFRVKSVKIYAGQKKFTRAPLVVLVTNIRYGNHLLTLRGITAPLQDLRSRYKYTYSALFLLNNVSTFNCSNYSSDSYCSDLS